MFLKRSFQQFEFSRLGFLLAWLAVCCGPTGVCFAVDDVVVLAGSRGEGEVRITGKVLDYTGQGLELEMSDGTQRTIQPPQVVRIETHRVAQHLEGLQRMQQGDYREALQLLRGALGQESRPWVQREIYAAAVRCYSAMGQGALGVRGFLRLVAADPRSPHFTSIPLKWIPAITPAREVEAAGTWLAQSDSEVAQLLGASYLLHTPRHEDALRTLARLSSDADDRIALLATTQRWRARLSDADADELSRWARALELMPPALRAGPYYLLGVAQSRIPQHEEEAALTLLRLPILYPEEYALAAAGLLEAGHQLQKLDRKEKAVGLYRELLEHYAGTQAASEAKTLVEQSAEGSRNLGPERGPDGGTGRFIP
jgi:tetratricopeptide (TPR) repeat protein